MALENDGVSTGEFTGNLTEDHKNVPKKFVDLNFKTSLQTKTSNSNLEI